MNFIKKNKISFICIGLVTLLTLVFYLNLFNRNDNDFFKNFQQDSESLVTGKIQADEAGVSTNGYGYGLYDKNSNTFSNAISLVGLQGYFYSFIYNILGLKNFAVLNLISCVLLAIVVVAISMLLKKQYDILFASVFYLVVLLSPWTVAMARNLFWAEFLMFLPAVFTLLMIRTENNKKLYIYLICLFFAAFAKSLCGYEFLTTVFLFALSFPIIEFFITKSKVHRVKMFKIAILSGVVFVLGFICAILIHANLRGDTIIEGLQNIWHQDVLRRTFGGNSADFDPTLAKSLLASPLEVIYMYVYGFTTQIILGISGQLFAFISFITVCALIYCSVKYKKMFSFENVSFVMYGITAISWLVFGKSHSYIHGHINFIIFYFGYVQICSYILIKFLMLETSNIKKFLTHSVLKKY